MSTQLTKLTEDLNKVSSLADQPTITASQLKAKFDEAGNAIKTYLNNTLTTEVEGAIDDVLEDLADVMTDVQALLDSLTAENVSYDNTTSGLTADDVQEAIDELKSAINTLSSSLGSTNTTVGKKTVYGDFAISAGSASPSISPLQDYSGTITITKSGYFPIGVVGVHFIRTFADMQLMRWELSSASSGRAVVSYRILNADNTRTLTPTLWVNVLWVKER